VSFIYALVLTFTNSTFFIIFPAVISILYPNLVQRVILISCSFAIYLAADIYADLHPPQIIRDVSYATVIIGFVGMLGFAYMFFSRFVKVNNLTRTRLQTQSEHINKNNQELEAHQTQIEKQQITLERANKELEQFAYIASHDLKTPLRNISSFLSLIKRRLKNHPDESVHEYLTFASTSAKQMHYLVEDILEYSRLGEVSLTLASVNLNDVVQTVMRNIELVIKEKGGKVFVEENLPTIWASETQFVLLFQNLIENGLKYNENEEPTVWIKSKNDEDKVTIIITDNGLGIPKEHFESIFKMFKRLHGQGEYQGSGVGLAICKKIVEEYGGDISVTHSPTGGSIFSIEFPKNKAIAN